MGGWPLDLPTSSQYEAWMSFRSRGSKDTEDSSSHEPSRGTRAALAWGSTFKAALGLWHGLQPWAYSLWLHSTCSPPPALPG